MLNGDSLTSIFAVTLMIMTVLMLGYHLAHFMSKHEFKSSESYAVIDRLPKLVQKSLGELLPKSSPEKFQAFLVPTGDFRFFIGVPRHQDTAQPPLRIMLARTASS